MSRLSMSCYAAAKHCPDRDGTVARMEPKEKPKTSKHKNKYGEIETAVSLDKYNGKMMFSIWGLYNRCERQFGNCKHEIYNFATLGILRITSRSRIPNLRFHPRDKRARRLKPNSSRLLFSFRSHNSPGSFRLRPPWRSTSRKLVWRSLKLFSSTSPSSNFHLDSNLKTFSE